MSQATNVLIKIRSQELNDSWDQLKEQLDLVVGDPGLRDKVRTAVQKNVLGEFKQTPTNEKLLRISHLLGLLNISLNEDERRRFKSDPHSDYQSPENRDLEEIEKLIVSCYEPFQDYVDATKNPFLKLANPPRAIPPDQIVAIFFEDDYLARPKDPIPFLIVPQYLERKDVVVVGQHPKPTRMESWIGVAHETGHHIYRNVPYLREELEVTFAKALDDYSATQQRLWFCYLEEIFADLVGVMTMGAAYVYSQYAIILGNVISSLDAGGNIKTEDLKKLLVGDDLTHPIPLIRGQLGIDMYTDLIRRYSWERGVDYPDMEDLDNFWVSLINPVQDMRDPHTPQSPSLCDNWNTDGKLDAEDIYGKMNEVVLDALLDTPLRSLGNNALGAIISEFFRSDEADRKTLSGYPKPELILGSGKKPRNIVAAMRLYVQKHPDSIPQ